MTQVEGTDEVAALEQARARLEAALSSNASWRALRRDDGDRDRLERALADDPLYKSWKLVNEAIGNLRPATGRAEPATREQRNVASAADDLTRIRGISAELARRLSALGIVSYGEIAAWRSDDVRRVSEALGLGRAISRQNWIEQAALLERRLRATPAEAVASPAVAEAIHSAPAAAPEPLSSQDADAHADDRAIDLPDILEHIRNDAVSRGGEVPAVPLAAEDKAPEEATKAPADVPQDADDDVPATTMPATPQRSPIPTVAASSHVNTDAAERAKRLEEERRQLSEGAGRAGRGPDETSVTFVIREPVTAASQPSNVATVRGAQREAPLFHPPPGPVEQADGRGDTYVPADNQAAEAEVVIVATDSSQARVSEDRGSRPVRRFFRTLMGN